jgi:CHAD domain-containing protein
MRSDARSSSGRIRAPARSEPYGTEFARLVEKWRKLLARSARKPTPSAVHDLRVATLRLQAGVEYWAGRRHDHPLTRQAVRWIAQSRKLRDVLGPVRGADVTLEKLRILEENILGSNGAAPADASECVRQIKKLERREKRARSAGTREVVDWLEEKSARLERRMLRLEKALDQLNPFPAGCGAVLLSEFLADHATFAASKLDGKALHEFRKQIKEIRYISELSTHGERSFEVLFVPLRTLQSALGEWHDWDSLVRTARREFGDSGKGECLVHRLESRAAKALRSALAQTRRSLAALSAGIAKPRPLR